MVRLAGLRRKGFRRKASAQGFRRKASAIASNRPDRAASGATVEGKTHGNRAGISANRVNMVEPLSAQFHWALS
jgi:hypothetical protein